MAGKPAFEVKAEFGYEVPVFKMRDSVKKRIGRVGSAAVLSNIRTQKQTTGEPIKPNPPARRRMKRRKYGGRARSLIEKEHRFVKGSKKTFFTDDDENVLFGSGQSWVADFRGETSVVIKPRTQMLARLSKWAQEKGYVGWFGHSKRSVAALRAVLAQWIKDEVKRAKKKSTAKAVRAEKKRFKSEVARIAKNILKDK